MKKRIIISVNSNLLFDQRVEKVCESLYKNSFEILLIGRYSESVKPKMKRNYRFIFIPHFFTKTFLFYAEINLKFFFLLLKNTTKNDILLANDLDILLPNYLVSKIKKCKLIFDAHEIFPELPSVQGRKVKIVWKKLEEFLVPKIEKMYTVSEGLKKYYQNNYEIPCGIIANVPRSYPLNDFNKAFHHKKFILYQGTINPYRGIDKMILAMKYVSEVDLLIAGNGPKIDEYKNLVIKENLSEKVYFLGNIIPEELRKLTPQAEFGLSLEENGGMSYFYSLPNKLFDYIHAEIPVLGTYLPEIKSIIEHNSIGITIENHDIQEIATKINKLLKHGKTIYKENLIKAKKEYCWENQEKKLIEYFD